MWKALSLLAVLAVGVDGARPRAESRDTPAKIDVTSCRANTDPDYTVASSNRTARYVETVTISDARPNRRVFLAWARKEAGEKAYEHSFSSGCGQAAHVGLGAVTDMVMGLYHVTRGRKLVSRADDDGVATFEIGVDECKKYYYQGYDWITSHNCLSTRVANGPTAPPPANRCSSCTSAGFFPDVLYGAIPPFPLGGQAEDWGPGGDLNSQIPNGPCVPGDRYDYLTDLDNDFDGDGSFEQPAVPETCVIPVTSVVGTVNFVCYKGTDALTDHCLQGQADFVPAGM